MFRFPLSALSSHRFSVPLVFSFALLTALAAFPAAGDVPETAPAGGAVAEISAGTEPGTVTLIGQVFFKAREQTCDDCAPISSGIRRLRGAYFEVREESNLFLGSDYLDRDGKFKIEVPNVGLDGIDPHLVLFATDDKRVIVRKKNETQWSARYPKRGPIAWNLPDGPYDVGPVIAGPTQGTQALYIYDEITTRGYEFLEANAGWGIGVDVDDFVEVRWPAKCLTRFPRACYVNDVIYLPVTNNDDASIDVKNDSGKQSYTILHEYGHFVHSRYLGSAVFWACAENFWRHSFLTETNPQCAWTEGWASYFSMVVRGSALYGDWDMEKGAWRDGKSIFEPGHGNFLGDRGVAPHDDFESTVTASLWDIYDPPSGENHDQVHDGWDGPGLIPGLWALGVLSDVTTVGEFYQVWEEVRGLDCPDTAIAHHHMLEIPPIYHVLDAGVEPAGGGSIDRDPPPACADSHPEGQVVELTAMPEPGHELSHWQGDVSSISPRITLRMDTDREVTAHFCTPPDCPGILIASPDPLELRGRPDDTVTGVVTLYNPTAGEVTYDITSQNVNWLTVSDPGPFSVGPFAAVEVELQADCSGEVQKRDGSYRLALGGGSEIEHDVLNVCSDYEIEPRKLEITAEVNESGSAELTIRNRALTVFLPFDFYHSKLTFEPASGRVWPLTTKTITVTATCPATKGVRTFIVDAEIQGLPESIEVTRRCVEDGGSSSGDPHLITYDGLKYDFQGHGEFLAAAGTGFEVQVRQEQWGSRPVTVNTAVAAQVASDRVAFYRDQDPVLWIDGVPTALNDGEVLNLPGGGAVNRSGNAYGVVWPDGDSSITVDRRSSFFGGYLGLFVAPGDAVTDVAGLFGNNNGDRSDDLALRDPPAYLEQPVPFDVLHGIYADSWRITDVAESLFDYDVGGGPDDYNDSSFPAGPTTLGDLDPGLVSWARTICEGLGITDPVLLDACILDVALTGDPSIGEATAEVQNASFTEVYAADFEAGPVGSEWSFTQTEVIPAGGRSFLGQLNNDTVTLSLSDLPAHAEVTVTFDLYLIRSWDGNSELNGGEDVWSLSSGGATLLETTFSNLPDEDQAYPDPLGVGDWPYHTGASEIDTLGYDFFGDCVQRITRTFEHTGSTLVLEFEARDLEPIVNESWGLDNVSVSISAP